MRKRELIAVWFSCGAASAVAAKLTIERYGATHDIAVLNTPVMEEDADNRRFARDVSGWLGAPILTAINSKFPNSSADEVWVREKFMSSPEGATCTRLLKKGARQQWEALNNPDWHVLGFTLNERDRHERFILTERANVLPILIEAGMTKGDCFSYLIRAGIRLPRVYRMGYPNGNCIGCPKASSPTYWNHVRVQHPEVFAARAARSRELGARLVRVNGRRIFLDELSPDAQGRPMKDMNFECGIFCEEPAPVVEDFACDQEEAA